METVVFTEEELHDKCTKWQKILRLQDWDVRASIVRERGMKAEDANAEIDINTQHRVARIRIIDPIDFDPENMNPQDMEFSLVHELLHIHLWPFTEGISGPLQDAEEQAINMIAGALIQLYRQK